MAKTKSADIAQEIEEAQPVPKSVIPRKYTVDRGGGQIHVTLASDEKDHWVQLKVNNKTVDSKESINGKVTLQFQNGWPKEDFTWQVK